MACVSADARMRLEGCMQALGVLINAVGEGGPYDGLCKHCCILCSGLRSLPRKQHLSLISDALTAAVDNPDVYTHRIQTASERRAPASKFEQSWSDYHRGDQRLGSSTICATPGRSAQRRSVCRGIFQIAHTRRAKIRLKQRSARSHLPSINTHHGFLKLCTPGPGMPSSPLAFLC